MKARVKNDRPTLSIGLIVKNEEKKLKRCLDSLHELMEKVACELIIVDTGSEDNTIEVAKKYTDQVYYFEWINDFAAARNFGLDKSSGKWFLFVDADEVLKEPEELIQFLNDDKNVEKYRTCILICHSLLNKDETIVSRSWVSRLFLNGMGNRFEGKIHEVPKTYPPVKYFKNTYLWHDGYVYETKEEEQRKRDRNNQLLEGLLEEEPDNLRLISLYVTTCPNEKRLEILEHGREILQHKPDDFYMSDIYWRLSRILFFEKKYEEVIALYEEYQKLTAHKPHVGEIELVLNVGSAYGVLKKFDKAAEAYERYLYLYHEYYEGDILETDNMLATSERISKQYLNYALDKCAICYDLTDNPLKAFEKIIQIDFEAVESINLSNALKRALNCAEKLERFDLACKLDNWIQTRKTEKSDIKPYQNHLVKYLWNIFWTEGMLEKALADTAGLTGELPELFQVIAPDGNWVNLCEKLQQDRKYLELYRSLLLGSALRYHRDPSVLLAVVGRESLSSVGNMITAFTPKPELADMLLSWENMPVINEVLFRGWMAELYCSSFADCPEEKKLPILHRMMEELAWYTAHLYHPDLLVPDEKTLLALPSPHRFGYWMGLALEEEKSGNHLQYIQYLRSAAKSCPEMAQAVKMLVQEAQDNDEVLKAKREQQELSQKIKGIIEGMILAGNKEEAQSVLAQYELIAPNDPDIVSLKGAILQQPMFSEA